MDGLSTLPKSRWEQGEALTVSFVRCFTESLGLNLRRREVCRAAKSALESVGSVSWLDEGRVLILDDRELPMGEIATVLNKIDQRFERIAARPLSARAVEHTLGITARERSRWTKDGRLARAGTNLIRRGQLIALSTYAVSEIARLTNEPETIRVWRNADARRVDLARRRDLTDREPT